MNLQINWRRVPLAIILLTLGWFAGMLLGYVEAHVCWKP